MGGRREYTQAREGGARGALKAAEREGPLSQNIGVSELVLQEPVVEGATGRGGAWSEQLLFPSLFATAVSSTTTTGHHLPVHQSTSASPHHFFPPGDALFRARGTAALWSYMTTLAHHPKHGIPGHEMTWVTGGDSARLFDKWTDVEVILIGCFYLFRGTGVPKGVKSGGRLRRLRRL